ncbi:methyl-CpG-binding domain protein 5-like [Oncorhynchus kisutch]|uniref:methyl-CpG-binding domain protein 5-like n=1 Tax=Oncorhynchus kisutch TaxID=8019 RepID=UPI0012DD6B3E|nr:methyl-CpG-binding domain protein 5-like [Oncorhynchus kisutch]
MQGLPPGYQGSQQPGFPENNNSSNAHPMACLFQNFQGCLPDNSISVPHSQMISQSGMTSLPESQGMLSHTQFGVSQQEMQQTQGEGLPPGMHGSDRLPSGGVESVDAIYRAVVDAASKGMHVVITTTVSGTTQSSPVPTLSTMTAFTNSVGEPVSINHNLPHSHAAVSHSGHRVAHQEVEQTPTLSQQPRPRQVRAGRPQKHSGQGKSTVSIPEGQGALPEASHQDYFRSPGHGTPRGQWEGETGYSGSLDRGHTAWGGEEFLECSTHVRSSPCMERPGSLAPAPPCPADSSPHEGHHHSLPAPSDKAFLEDGFNRFNNCNRTAVNIVNYKERLDQTVERCAHMNGGWRRTPPGPVLSTGVRCV